MVYWFKPAVTESRTQVFDGTNWVNLRGDPSGYLINKVGSDGTSYFSLKTDNQGFILPKIGYDGTTYYSLKVDDSGRLYVRPYVYEAGPETYTSTGTGTEVDSVFGVIQLTWQILSDSSASNMDIKLEGSIDGTNWFVIDEYVGTGNTLRHVVNKCIRYFRVNVASLGDASSVTVRIFGIR